MAKRALAGVLRGLSLCVTVPALSARPSIAFQEGRRGQGERAADLGAGGRDGRGTMCRRGQGEGAADLGRGEENHVQGPRSRPSLSFPPLARTDLAKGERRAYDSNGFHTVVS